MAMINCPECGKEVSDKAANCPGCGCPIGFGSAGAGTNGAQYHQANTYQQNFTPQPVRAYVHEPEKNSGLGVAALVFSILGITFFIGIILAIVDLCKKDGRKKVLSIVSLCVCAFWIILAVSVGGDSDNKKDTVRTESKSVVQESKDADTNEKTVSKVEETKEIEESVPIEPEEEETEMNDKYNVGDTWKNKYVLVSFDKCGVYESDNQFIQPASGNKYIYATFTFENIGNSDTTVGCWDFDCYADGYACDGTYGADDAGFSQTLSAGRKITGTVYFEVPENASEIELEFSPSFWTSEKIVFVYQ